MVIDYGSVYHEVNSALEKCTTISSVDSVVKNHYAYRYIDATDLGNLETVKRLCVCDTYRLFAAIALRTASYKMIEAEWGRV